MQACTVSDHAKRGPAVKGRRRRFLRKRGPSNIFGTRPNWTPREGAAMTGPQTSARHKQQGEEAFGPAQGDSSRSNGVQLRKRDCGPRCPENFLTTSHLCPGAPTPAGSEQPWQDRAGPPSVVAALICKRGVTDDRGRPGVLCTPCRSCRLSWGRGCAVASRTMAGRMPTVPPAPPACLPPASGWGGFLSLEEKKQGHFLKRNQVNLSQVRVIQTRFICLMRQCGKLLGWRKLSQIIAFPI